MTIDLRLGRWEEALADVEMVDAIIVDAPYSAKTHSGSDAGAMTVPGTVTRSNGRVEKKEYARQLISYAAWSEDDVNAFVAHWGPRCRGWFCTITDHILAPVWSAALAMPENGGRYVFAPIPIVETGSRVRLTGDGPSSWTCWMIVARPKTPEFVRWGTLPGAYIGSGRGDREHIGGKDSAIMRAIVRDYTRPGDLVCDPCLGGGTTALAAAIEGRRFVGSEMDPATFEKAQKRIARGYTPTMFASEPAPVMRQEGLDLDAPR